MLTVIASWPKSGNTWMRSILTCYLRNECVALDDMGKIIPIDSAKGLWNKYLDLPELENDEVFPNRKRFYKALKEKLGDKNLYLKAHSANLTVNEDPMFDHEVIDKVIHIVRNPFDVLPSFASHMGINIEEAWERMQRDTMALNTTEKQYREMVSSWELHTKSFLARNCHPDKYVMVRYEDMRLKPFTTLKKVIEFLDIGFNEERLVKALYWSSFENRKKEEEEGGFKENPREDNKFFRKGKIGGFKDEVPEKIHQEMLKKYTDFCGQLGYKVA